MTAPAGADEGARNSSAPQTGQELPGGTGTPPEGSQGADGAHSGQPEGGAPEAKPEGETKPDKASREAARYRTERNEAQAALTALQERVENYQRDQVRGIAAGVLANPDDVLLFTAPDEFLDDAGEVSESKVLEAARALAEVRPGLAKAIRHPKFGQGAGHPTAGAPAPSWAALFGPPS